MYIYIYKFFCDLYAVRHAQISRRDASRFFMYSPILSKIGPCSTAVLLVKSSDVEFNESPFSGCHAITRGQTRD